MAQAKSRASAFQVVRMVLSAFLGIRKREEHEKFEVTPVQVIVTAVVAAGLFVVTVVSVVRWVTG